MGISVPTALLAGPGCGPGVGMRKFVGMGTGSLGWGSVVELGEAGKTGKV